MGVIIEFCGESTITLRNYFPKTKIIIRKSFEI